MSAGADWFNRRLGGGPPPPPPPPPNGYQPVQPGGWVAPGQAFYQPPPQQVAPQGYQPVQPGPQQYGQLLSGPAVQDEGLLVTEVQEPPLLRYARAAKATGGSHGARQHMQTCPTCRGVMYVTQKRDGSEHAHCHNCGYQPGVREGHPQSMGAPAGGVARSRQYDPSSHYVEAVDPETKQTLVYEPNRRQ